MARPALRAVTEDQEAKPTNPKSVTEAFASGTRREQLEALQSRVASAVQDPSTPGRDLASLTRRLQEIAKELDLITDDEPEAGHAHGYDDEAFDATAV